MPGYTQGSKMATLAPLQLGTSVHVQQPNYEMKSWRASEWCFWYTIVPRLFSGNEQASVPFPFSHSIRHQTVGHWDRPPEPQTVTSMSPRLPWPRGQGLP